MVAEICNGQAEVENDCFMANLNTPNCRLGCGNCTLNEIFAKIEAMKDKIQYDTGKSPSTTHRCFYRLSRSHGSNAGAHGRAVDAEGG